MRCSVVRNAPWSAVDVFVASDSSEVKPEQDHASR